MPPSRSEFEFERSPPLRLRESGLGRDWGLTGDEVIVASRAPGTAESSGGFPAELPAGFLTILHDQLLESGIEGDEVVARAAAKLDRAFEPDLVSVVVRRRDRFETVGAVPVDACPSEPSIVGNAALIARCLYRGDAVLARRVRSLADGTSAADAEISEIAAALLGRAGTVGVIYLARAPGSPPFVERDLDAAVLLAAALARNLDSLVFIDELRRTNILLGNVLDALEDGVVITDERLRVVTTNESARRILVEPDLEGSDLRTVLARFELDIHPSAITGAGRFHLHRRKNLPPRRPGHSFASAICNVSVRRVHEAGHRAGWVFCLHGGAVPTEAAQLQAFLRRRLTHDLVSRLTLLNNIAEIVLENTAAPSDEELKSLLRSSFESAQKWKEFLRRLVERTPRTRTAGDAPWDEVGVEQLLHEALQIHADLIRRKSFHVVCDVPAGAGALRGDPDQLRLVFQHLVHNAVRFGHLGGHLCVRSRIEDEHTVLTFEDDGPGISRPSRELLDLVVHQDQWPRPGGNESERAGLGLWIVHSVVEAHGGRVRIDSHDDHHDAESGTVVELALPRVQAVLTKTSSAGA